MGIGIIVEESRYTNKIKVFHLPKKMQNSNVHKIFCRTDFATVWCETIVLMWTVLSVQIIASYASSKYNVHRQPSYTFLTLLRFSSGLNKFIGYNYT